MKDMERVVKIIRDAPLPRVLKFVRLNGLQPATAAQDSSAAAATGTPGADGGAAGKDDGSDNGSALMLMDGDLATSDRWSVSTVDSSSGRGAHGVCRGCNIFLHFVGNAFVVCGLPVCGMVP